MVSLVIGIVLLIVGIGLTVASPHSIYYGAIAVGVINIIRGLVQLSQSQNTGDNDHRL
jgi:uncharacterized membrane protein HdeD (DUF308 family)